VAAQTGSRVERHEPERLGRRRLDDFPHADAEPVAHERQLVDQADVDRPERVLEQLHHLGDPGRADLDDRGDRGAVELARQPGADGRVAAHHLRHVARVPGLVARIDALGREGQEEIAAGHESLFFEQRPHDFVGRARVRRRLEDDELARPQVLCDRLHGRDDERKIGIARLPQRRRHADVDGVEHGDRRRVGRRRQPARSAEAGDVGIGYVADVGPPGVDGLDLAGVEIDAQRFEPAAGKLDGQRESDVAESDDADFRRAAGKLVGQGRGKGVGGDGILRRQGIRHWSMAEGRSSLCTGKPAGIDCGVMQEQGRAMLIRSRKSWELPYSAVTPEPIYRSRREFMRTATAGLLGAAAGTAIACGDADSAVGAQGRLTATRNAKYSVADPPNSFEHITSYNNFYEFGLDKDDPARYAGRLKVEPWSVKVDGLVGRPGTYGVDELVDFNALEERIYRLRCVEAWSMVIPWIGVPLASVLQKVEP